MTDLDELSRLLEQATPGPWRDDNGYRVYANTPEGEVLLLSTKQTCATFADSGLIAALRNCADELIRDARRYRWLRDLKCNSVSVSHDEDHACNYVTAAQWIEECSPEDFRDDAPDEVERMKAANSIWRVQVYPNTPIGFNVWHGATLDAAIDAAIAQEQP